LPLLLRPDFGSATCAYAPYLLPVPFETALRKNDRLASEIPLKFRYASVPSLRAPDNFAPEGGPTQTDSP
jgi:hypothetical protein